MPALLQKIGAALSVMPKLSDIDRGIIEAMIEIGAGAKEIAETFGYAPEQIAMVKATQPMSPYRILST